MFHIVLYQPEIPPNTGTIMRLCAATGTTLHLIEPLGFSLSDKQLQRAGMDYRERTNYHRHMSWDYCYQWIQNTNEAQNLASRFFAFTTKGSESYTNIRFNHGDVLIFGPETRGLPESLLTTCEEGHRLRIPMKSGERSLNLALSTAVVVYEALRQTHFDDLV